MKIKLIVVDNNSLFVEHFSDAIVNHYSDRLEPYFYSDLEGAQSAIAKNNKKDAILLVDKDLADDIKNVHFKGAIALSDETAENARIGEYSLIGKYQKMDNIYKQLLKVSSLVSNSNQVVRDNACRISLFFSPVGGCGTSSCAVAFAQHEVLMGRRALYLDLQLLSNPSILAVEENAEGFSEIIYALKNNQNTSLAVRSVLRQDASGVYFFKSANLPIDMLELHKDDIEDLISELVNMGDFDSIAVDTDFAFADRFYSLCAKADQIFMVTDNTPNNLSRSKKTLTVIRGMEEDGAGFEGFSAKIRVIINKNMAGNSAGFNDIQMVARIPNLGDVTQAQAISQILPRLEKIG